MKEWSKERREQFERSREDYKHWFNNLRDSSTQEVIKVDFKTGNYRKFKLKSNGDIYKKDERFLKAS